VIDYAAILIRRFEGREWKLEGDSYEGLTMLDDGPKPSKKSLDDLWLAVRAEIEAEADAKISARKSALQKLSALGLTEIEIVAILGE